MLAIKCFSQLPVPKNQRVGCLFIMQILGSIYKRFGFWKPGVGSGAWILQGDSFPRQIFLEHLGPLSVWKIPHASVNGDIVSNEPQNKWIVLYVTNFSLWYGEVTTETTLCSLNTEGKNVKHLLNSSLPLHWSYIELIFGTYWVKENILEFLGGSVG